MVKVVLPGFSPQLRVKSIAQDGDLAPTVPTCGDDNLVAIQCIGLVLEDERIPRRSGYLGRSTRSRRRRRRHEEHVQGILPENL